MTAAIYQHKTIVAVLYRKHVTPPTCHFVLRLIIASVIPHLWNGGTGTSDGNANIVLSSNYIHLVFFLTSLSLLQSALKKKHETTFCLSKKKKIRLIVLNDVFGKKTWNKWDFSHKIVSSTTVYNVVLSLL